jgi:hypothetical protein
MPPRRRPRFAIPLIVFSAVLIVVAVVGYVLAETRPVLPGLRGCELVRDTQAQGRCVQRELRDAMSGREAVDGLEAVDDLAAESQLVSSHCHLAMHPIGEEVGRRSAQEDELPPAADGESTCRRGFMHGAMIGYVTERSDGDISGALPALCERDDQSPSGCSHVVGHLVAREAGTKDAEPALIDGCTVPDVGRDIAATDPVTPQAARECVRGGMMEIALMERQPRLATWAKRCARSPAETREECYAWLPPLALYHQQTVTDAQDACPSRNADADLREACLAGVARFE